MKTIKLFNKEVFQHNFEDWKQVALFIIGISFDGALKFMAIGVGYAIITAPFGIISTIMSFLLIGLLMNTTISFNKDKITFNFKVELKTDEEKKNE